MHPAVLVCTPKCVSPVDEVTVAEELVAGPGGEIVTLHPLTTNAKPAISVSTDRYFIVFFSFTENRS